MPRRTALPEMASIAEPVDQRRLSAPSAERNAAPIAEVLGRFAPKSGHALELASGTGQHVLTFARTFPDIIWQPTDIDPMRRTSIDAWKATDNLPNLRPAIALDATAQGWGDDHANQDVIVLVNLLHLISDTEARCLITEAARALAPAGRFFLYGPFLRDGEATSEADAQFHASLRRTDPEIGYKDAGVVLEWLNSAGLSLVELAEMPANNLTFVTEQSSET